MNISSLHSVQELLKWWVIPHVARRKVKDVILKTAQGGFLTCLNIWVSANCCCKAQDRSEEGVTRWNFMILAAKKVRPENQEYQFLI